MRIPLNTQQHVKRYKGHSIFILPQWIFIEIFFYIQQLVNNMYKPVFRIIRYLRPRMNT